MIIKTHPLSVALKTVLLYVVIDVLTNILMIDVRWWTHTVYPFLKPNKELNELK